MTTKTKYPFSPGDIVATKAANHRGVVRSVGPFGAEVRAAVTWFDTKETEFVAVGLLKKSLRPIDGGKDPDT